MTVLAVAIGSAITAILAFAIVLMISWIDSRAED